MQASSRKALANMKRQKPRKSSTRAAPTRSTASSSSAAPAARSSPIRTNPSARFSNGGQNSVILRHSEFFDEVVGITSGFNVVGTYPLQPGCSELFPWLSRIAPNYETYRFRYICFRYRARCPSITAGLAGMVFDFDALDTAPTDQMYALSYHDKSSDAPWKDMELRLDLRSDRLPVHFTRSAPVANSDLKTYDLGNLFVFTSGVGAPGSAVTCGILEVDYEVELFTPQLEPVVGGTFWCQDGCSSSQLVGTDSNVVPGCPVRNLGNGVLEFTRPFEGLMTMVAQAVNAGSPPRFQLTNDGGKGLADSLHYGSVPAADGSEDTVSSVFRILAPLGAHMAPFLVAGVGTLIHRFDVDFGAGKYGSYY